MSQTRPQPIPGQRIRLQSPSDPPGAGSPPPTSPGSRRASVYVAQEQHTVIPCEAGSGAVAVLR